MLGELPRVPTPKKTKSKSKGSVVIIEPSGDEQQQKRRKVVGLLKILTGKKQINKPIKKKKKTIEVTILGTNNDYKAIETKDIDLSKGQSMIYHNEANTDDADHMINDAFVNDTLPVSPQKVATVESNTNEIRNPDVTVNTSNVDTNITNAKTRLQSLA
ncbi:unnamed protein product [Lactuca virosa]|uniref:Uncharacterized protein n=1 Tax=Lactuca virosa TaxID=75947 RepID=A0AAU9MU14_9ASTR|nr:unnamed protein product [Lactuca virosa]